MVQQDTLKRRLGQRLSFSCVSTDKSLYLTSLIGSGVQAEDYLKYFSDLSPWEQLPFEKGNAQRGREGTPPLHPTPSILTHGL